MEKNRIVILGVIVAIMTIVYYSINGGEESIETYTAKIENKRKENHGFLRTSEESPLSAEEKKKFKGLEYFSADKKYQVNAILRPVEGNKMLIIPTSNGKEKKYVKYAFAEFELNGTSHRLLLLQDFLTKNNTELFLPFADPTNGNETYGGGRYIDIKLSKPGSKQVTIDFNLAYNPYCVYNYDFSCPLPPKENILNTPIYAGEKNYHSSIN